MQIGNINCRLISAGTWWGDGGAALGILPKSLWQKLYPVDEKNRIQLALNLLLIQVNGKNILIDTGIGNKITPKQKKIYSYTEFTLLTELEKIDLKRTDIDFVILTHLHFDHAGGIISKFGDKLELTFPNAMHLTQKQEWEMAKHPDELNAASYNFKDDLLLLEQTGNYKLIEGNYEVMPGITCEQVGGHSIGMQVVRLESENDLAYYASDIIPLEAQRHLAITSAYDVSRIETFAAKKKILTELKSKNGYLFFNHDVKKNGIRF